MTSSPEAYSHFKRSAEAVYAGLSTIQKAVAQSGLSADLVELVDLRVSQINGCAFCIQHHLSAARRLGIPDKKLDLLAAWRDAGIFAPAERAALEWAEALTHLTPGSSIDEARIVLGEHFTDDDALFLTTAIGTINNWNRLAVGLRFSPAVSE